MSRIDLTAKVAKQRSAEKQRSASKQPAQPRPATSATGPDAPLVRKECFLREDQSEALRTIRRRVNTNRRAARAEGKSMTETALIRVALDLLIANEHRLTGYTEQDLLNSLLTTD